jgi:CHAT domain-containing protein
LDHRLSGLRTEGPVHNGQKRRISRWEHEAILEALQARLDRNLDKMRVPAIVLTPDPSDAKDSGLFTTKDIAAMNLDNVWLAIIAACHTAGASPDSLEEGLSGLGLAFATAGAKALILSYWDAEPSATEKLLERTLTLINNDTNLSLSDALAVSMKELRNNKYTPEQWAPFVVIGDGTIKIPAR